MAKVERLFVKVTRESLPQVKDKYPFIYLERGRLEFDDSSVKWIADTAALLSPVQCYSAVFQSPQVMKFSIKVKCVNRLLSFLACS